MSRRVSKKLVTPFDKFDPDAAILVVNLIDAQVNTLKVFQKAIEEKRLPYFVVGNKIDKVNPSEKIKEVEKELGCRITPVSALTGQGIKKVKKGIEKFKPGSRIVVLGVFNAGKTSLISKLTGLDLKIGEIPGTTLEFVPYQYEKYTLIDTVGQIIDINKPMMVSVDLSGCKTVEEKISRVLKEDANAILATREIAMPKIKKVVQVIKRQVDKGKKIIVTGAGASALVAMEMAGQGLETGLPISVFTNNLAELQPVSFAKGVGEEEAGLSNYIARMANKGDILVGISASGGTGFVYHTLNLAHRKGAVTVAITENPDTPLGKQADYIIKSNAKPEGPCLHPETWILTKNDGLKKIKSVKPGEKVLTVKKPPSHQASIKYHDSNGFQVRGLKWGIIENISKTTVKHLYKIKYRNWGTLKVTGDHILFVRKRAGVYPKKASEIEKGDVLVGLPEIDPKGIGLKESNDLELTELLGYYTAEGSIGERSVIFTINGSEAEFKKRIISLMSRKFKANHKIVEKNEGSAIDLWFYSSKAAEFFEKNCGRGAKNKHVPKMLWNGDISSFRSYIKAYARGDGYLTKKRKMRIRSASKRIIEELAWLCRLHNIPCSISKMKQPKRKIRNRVLPEGALWQLQIGKNSWRELIGEKEERIVKWKTPKGVVKRDLSEPIKHRNKVASVEKVLYEGPVYDIVDCEEEVFYAGNVPVLVHNSSSKIQIAHLAIVHSILLALADQREITADQSINFMLPEKIPTKKMGIK